jgi:hypothetical protein
MAFRAIDFGARKKEKSDRQLFYGLQIVLNFILKGGILILKIDVGALRASTSYILL